MSDYEIDDIDRKLLAKVAKALAYYNDGNPLRDFLEVDDITDALKLLMRVIKEGDRDEAVAAFVAEYRSGYGADPSEALANAAGGKQ